MYGDYISKEMTEYCEKMSGKESALLKKLKEDTFNDEQWPEMLSGHVEGRLLKMLVQLTGAKLAVEIGTFTGYSALCIAEGLPEDGKLITCDIDKHPTDMAQKFFAQSPHGHKIEFRMGPALQTLETINQTIDFAFIDADKENYKNYYEVLVPKLKKGGIIVLDNCFWSGKVLAPHEKQDRHTKAITATNEFIIQDTRVENVLLSVRDGVNVVRKL